MSIIFIYANKLVLSLFGVKLHAYVLYFKGTKHYCNISLSEAVRVSV